MSTKKEKKVINARRRRNEYILDNSDDGELSEDIQESKRRSKLFMLKIGYLIFLNIFDFNFFEFYRIINNLIDFLN